MLGERQELLAERPADDLVQRVVPADVLADAERLAPAGEEPRRMKAPGNGEGGLRLPQPLRERRDERERHPQLRLDSWRLDLDGLERSLSADAAGR